MFWRPVTFIIVSNSSADRDKTGGGGRLRKEGPGADRDIASVSIGPEADISFSSPKGDRHKGQTFCTIWLRQFWQNQCKQGRTPNTSADFVSKQMLQNRLAGADIYLLIYNTFFPGYLEFLISQSGPTGGRRTPPIYIE